MAEERHEFAGPGWFDCLRGLITERLSSVDLTGITQSFSEEYTGAPAHLVPEDRTTIGWHYRIEDGALDIRDTPYDDADRRIVADYDTIVPIARLRYSDPDIGKLAQAAIASGQLRSEGTDGDPRVQAALARLHDDLANVTA